MAPEDTPAQPPADTELKSIGRYELIDKIGKGGMGVVYRGKDTVIGRLVAIKMWISDIDVSEETRERFFHKQADDRWQIDDRIRKDVTFTTINFLEDSFPAAPYP